MATIQLRRWSSGTGEKVAWGVNYKDPLGKRRLKNFKEKGDAQKFLKLVKGGKPAALGKQFTVADACNRYLRICEQRHRDDDRMSRATLARLWNLVDTHVVPFIGSIKLADLSPIMVDAYIDEMRRHKEPRTPLVISQAVGVLNRSLTEMQRLQIISRNVVKDVPPRKPPIKLGVVEVPTKDEISRILEASVDIDRTIMEIAIFTGLRAGEICGLAWSDVDFNKGTLSVRRTINVDSEIRDPKSKAGKRTITVPNSTMLRLRSLKDGTCVVRRGIQKKDPDIYRNLVFWGRTRPLTATTLFQGPWTRVCKAVALCSDSGRPKYHFHALRHVAASLFIESGIQPKRVQQLMGHTSIKMTFDVYGHLFPDEGAARQASECIAQQFGR